jgi:hypothetical protein
MRIPFHTDSYAADRDGGPRTPTGRRDVAGKFSSRRTCESKLSTNV